MRAAGLGASPGQAFTAEGLAADDRANLVAVGVDVTGTDPPEDGVDPLVDPRMDAEGQAVARRVDGLNHGFQLTGTVGCNVQHGAKDLAFQCVDPINGNQRRGDETAIFP